MQSEYQKPRANLKAVQREVDRLREIESEHQYTQKRPSCPHSAEYSKSSIITVTLPGIFVRVFGE